MTRTMSTASRVRIAAADPAAGPVKIFAMRQGREQLQRVAAGASSAGGRASR